MSKIPYILISDPWGHDYLILESEKINFSLWVEAGEAGAFAKMQKYDYFNKCRIDLPKLKIYEWSEE